jgi:aspartate oxidase
LFLNKGLEMSSIKLQGNASNTGISVIQSANVSTTVTQTLPTLDGATLGYLNIPSSTNGTGTLIATDVGKFLSLSAGVAIPASVFAAGDVISLYNNTSGNLTITCSAVTLAYIAGTDTDKASVTLATRGVCTVLFIDATTCVLTGNVS